MAIPLIIDTDPGIDDAIAIMLAIASPEVDVLGITSVGGNAGIERTTENSLRLLHLLGRDDIPMAAGAPTPLVRADARPDPDTHGEDGFGGVKLEPAPRTADPRPAVQLLVDLIEASAQAVTLVAIGPLTNVAALGAAFPDSFAKLARIVVMGGGARRLGNVTAAAEFNIWFDPEAAARVFSAGVPITMVGLDVTTRAVTSPEDWAPLRGGGRLSAATLGMVDFYTEYHRAHYGTSDTAQHDSLALAAVIDPNVVTLQDCYVDVECAGTLTRGMTVVDVDDVLGRAPNASVALDVDSAAFTRLLVGRLTELDRELAS